MDDSDLRKEQNKKLLCEIAGELTRRGYGIAETLSGQRVEEPEPSSLGNYHSMGILVRATPMIFGVIPVAFVRKWAYPADLWIDNIGRRAVPDKRWVLDVYGGENLESMRELMQQIAAPHDVEVAAKVHIDKLRWAGQELHLQDLEQQVWEDLG